MKPLILFVIYLITFGVEAQNLVWYKFENPNGQAANFDVFNKISGDRKFGGTKIQSTAEDCATEFKRVLEASGRGDRITKCKTYVEFDTSKYIISKKGDGCDYRRQAPVFGTTHYKYKVRAENSNVQHENKVENSFRIPDDWRFRRYSVSTVNTTRPYQELYDRPYGFLDEWHFESRRQGRVIIVTCTANSVNVPGVSPVVIEVEVDVEYEDCN